MNDELLRNVPPHDLAAERAVLGALLIDNAAIDLVAQEINREHFYRPAHAVIYQSVVDLSRQGLPADAVTLLAALRKGGQLDAAGGIGEVSALTSVVPSSANAIHYARIVRDRALLRQAIQALAEAQREVFESRDPTEQLLDRIEKRLFEVTQRRVRSEAVGVGAVLSDLFAGIDARRAGGVPNLAWGYGGLDDLTHGLHKGDLVVIAARPSMGKTTFAINVLRNVCVGRPGHPTGHGAVFFSLEMPKAQIVGNILCSMAKVNTHALRGSKFLPREDEQALHDAAEAIEHERIWIDDTPGLTVMELRGKARRLRAEQKIDCVIVDYLQLMGTESAGKDKARHEVVAEISRSLKALARELEIPVVALAQLNRNVEDRPDHRPRLSDLRESGSIEQDADVVMFLHREEYYMTQEKAEAEGKKNKAQIVIAKNRNGPTGEAELYYAREIALFGAGA